MTLVGWERTTLGALGRYVNGRGFKRTEWGRDGRPIIRIQNLTGSSNTFNYYGGEVDDRHVVRRGDLLVAWAATLGAHLWDGPEALLNQHIFRVESNIDKRFHKYLLDHKLDEIMRHTHGSGMVHITRGAFDSLPVDVPEKAEQQRIVDLLEDHLSRLDAADRYLRAGIGRAGVWFGRLAAELVWSEEFPRAEVRSLLREPMRNGRSDRAVQGSGVGTRTLTLTAVTKSAFTDENTKLTTTTGDRARGLWLEPGDVFVQRSNTPALVGSSARYEGPSDWAIFPDLLIRLRADEDVIDSRFLAVALRSEQGHGQLRRRARGAAGSMPKIDQDAIGSALVPVPNRDDQQRILARVAEAEAGLIRLLSGFDLARRRSVVLRRSVLAAAFSGRLTDSTEFHP